VTNDSESNPYILQNSEINELSIFDRYYSRRDTLDLFGSVSNCRILDAGCGAGKYAFDLSQAGVHVVGIDNDGQALERAKSLAGATVDFHKADLTEPLTFLEPRSFDAVLCSLVLHYIENWSMPLTEFNNLLKPRGQLVVSVHHPFSDYFDAGSKSYFETEPWYSGHADRPFWRRPLEEIMASIADAGFALDTIREPRPCADPTGTIADLPRLLVIRALRKLLLGHWVSFHTSDGSYVRGFATV
jgi:SAM-dependent methyltransferase